MNLKDLIILQILKMSRLGYFCPYFLNIFGDDILQSLLVFILWEIPQDKNKLLKLILLEQFDIDFHNDPDDFILTSYISSYLCGPNIDDQNLTKSQGKKCGGLFELLTSVPSFLAIASLHVQNQ